MKDVFMPEFLVQNMQSCIVKVRPDPSLPALPF